MPPPKRGPSLRMRQNGPPPPQGPPPATPPADLHSFYRGSNLEDSQLPPQQHYAPPSVVQPQQGPSRPSAPAARSRAQRPPPRNARRVIAWDRIRLVFVYPIVALLAYGLLFNPAMRVNQLVAMGGDFSQDELEEQFNWSAWEGRYVWSLWWNRGKLLHLLNDHPRVERVRTRFILPGRLEVTFEPKERYAAFIHGGRAFWIAKDFTFCGLEPADQVAATRVMEGLNPNFLFGPDGKPLEDPFPEWPPLPGAPDDEKKRALYYYAKMLQLWRWMDHETNPAQSQVAWLELNWDRGIILHYKTEDEELHPPILLGWGMDLEHKYGQALTVYRSGRWWGERGIEIDLSADRNVVRTVGPAFPTEPLQPTTAMVDEEDDLRDPEPEATSTFQLPADPPQEPRDG